MLRVLISFVRQGKGFPSVEKIEKYQFLSPPFTKFSLEEALDLAQDHIHGLPMPVI